MIIVKDCFIMGKSIISKASMFQLSKDLLALTLFIGYCTLGRIADISASTVYFHFTIILYILKCLN